MKYDVIAIGSATQDVFLTADEFRVGRDAEFTNGTALRLPFGSKIKVTNIAFSSGGGGTNAAVTFSRAGMSTACIGVIGRDANGTALLDELRREGVDAKWFQISDEGMTAYSVILVGVGGERTILSYKGEGEHLAGARIPWDQMESSWLYVNSLGGHLDILSSAVAWAKRSGVHVATNPGTRELALGLEKLAPLYKSVDIVGMNQEEAAALLGMDYKNSDAIFKAMDERIGGIFIMTRGGQGVEISDGKFVYTAGIPPSNVVERTGAGDAFHSAFTAEFAHSGSIQQALQRATANSTAVVQHYGAKEGILKKGDWGPWPRVSVSKRPL